MGSNMTDFMIHTLYVAAYGDRLVVCFFFFQAEDGIRDYRVTGVQTCALPIWMAVRGGGPAGSVGDLHHRDAEMAAIHPGQRVGNHGAVLLVSDAGAWVTGIEIGRASCRERV